MFDDDAEPLRGQPEPDKELLKADSELPERDSKQPEPDSELQERNTKQPAVSVSGCKAEVRYGNSQ